MNKTGFVNLKERKFKTPIGTWPKDKKLKEIGLFNLANMNEGLEGFSLRLFKMVLGYTAEEVQLLIADVKRDMANRAIHSYSLV